jgi:Ser/Thr protein kinase RdoA (MazF antagonist)
MTLFDFFESVELPVPEITPEQAADIAASHFGMDTRITALGSQQDANFLLHDASGTPAGVLKIANPAFTLIELQAQDAAAAFILAGEGIRTATNVAPDGVPPIAKINGDGPLFARVITYLSGGTLDEDTYLSPVRSAALGDLAGRTCRALASFDHPGVDRVLQWDLRHANRTVEVLGAHVSTASQREAVESAATAAWQVVADLADDLPVQVIHGDVTGDNVI